MSSTGNRPQTKVARVSRRCAPRPSRSWLPRRLQGRDGPATHGRDAHATVCGRSRRGGPRAFTLVEMTVVTVIIVVLAGMIVPRLADSLGAANLRDSAWRLQMSAQYAHHVAVTRHCLCRLRLDPRQNQYALEFQEDPDRQPEKFSPLQGPARRRSLGEGVRFGLLRIESNSSGEDETIVCFDPTGASDAAVLEITDGRRVYSLVIVPSTGRAILVEGPARQLPTDRQDLDA